MSNLQQKKKFPIVKFLILILLVGLTATAYVFSGHLFGENSIFNTAVSSNAFVQTLYSFIPSLIRSIQIITIAICVNLVLKLLMMKSFARSKRGITVTKMLNNFIKWIVGIVAILLILGAWGVDTTTLVASAGIVSLIVGLGAQSLVADIIAGLFIVIEGEYQVGDIVVIDDWRGTVKEIGVRTTKIEDAGGNIKIVNNSEIKTIINQTKSLSVAKAYISIEYGESLPKVEKIINDNLGKIKDNIPKIINGPYYRGVNALSSSSVDLMFTANCQEEDIFQVQRDLNRELKILFDENGITIPFPQVVINTPSKKE